MPSHPPRRWIALLLSLMLLAGGLPASVAAPVVPPAVGTPLRPLPFTSEALALQSPWSRPQSYPLGQRPDPALYRPSAEWIGRLILPTPAELADAQAPPGDWVWIEVEQAPAGQQPLIGRRLRLRWADHPLLRHLVQVVTTDIHFGDAAREAAAAFNVVPSRLDGRLQVGPLQSLAGARPEDDVIVLLEGVQATGAELRVQRPPVQITGRWQGLVTLVGPAAGKGLQRARHFNHASGAFDGPEETIRIPALPPDRYGRRLLDPAGLAASRWNGQGWLIQGAPAADGVFTVQAIEPYALLELAPERRQEGTAASLAFLADGSWRGEAARRGSLDHTALRPDGAGGDGLAKPGDRALLMHLFGGIGGAEGERVVGWTVTGHFSFGEARVVLDSFTGRPRLALRYHQIYANNPNGIVSGSQDWSAYAGSLQRGWLGLRPFSDILIPLGAEALDAIALQTEILSARYRSGDGGGVALVTAATSCVQDSAQALWIAIQQLRLAGERNAWDPGDRERLDRLGAALDHLLTPFGRVRGDWSANAAVALAAGTGGFQARQGVSDVLLSWRSMLPRRAHDAFAAEFLWAGLPLRVLRTNQIPGADPRLAPLAPTTLFGQLPVVGLLLSRFVESLFPPLQPTGLRWCWLIAVAYAPLALALGRRSGWLPRRWRWSPPGRLLRRCAGLLLFPALPEEMVFRGLLVPSPLEGVPPAAMAAWIALSTGLFVAWHPLVARLRRPPLRQQLQDPRFLAQTALLGLACGLLVAVSGSLWPAVLLHGLAALVGREARELHPC